MDESTLWWLFAGATVGIELMIGTFYLLMVATGLAAAAIAAHLGLPMPAQLVTAALVSGGAVVAWISRQSTASADGASRTWSTRPSPSRSTSSSSPAGHRHAGATAARPRLPTSAERAVPPPHAARAVRNSHTLH